MFFGSGNSIRLINDLLQVTRDLEIHGSALQLKGLAIVYVTFLFLELVQL